MCIHLRLCLILHWRALQAIKVIVVVVTCITSLRLIVVIVRVLCIAVTIHLLLMEVTIVRGAGARACTIIAILRLLRRVTSPRTIRILPRTTSRELTHSTRLLSLSPESFLFTITVRTLLSL